jgi:hypothetical protein
MAENRLLILGILFLVLLSLPLAWNCSRRSSLSPSDGMSAIQIVIVPDDEKRVDTARKLNVSNRTKIIDDKTGRSDRIGSDTQTWLNSFDGDVWIKVYDQDYTERVSRLLECETVNDTTICNGIIAVPPGNYQVAVEARDFDGELQKYGIDVAVNVILGETTVDTIRPVDFVVNLPPPPERYESSPFVVSWDHLQYATAYNVEVDTDISFTPPLDTLITTEECCSITVGISPGTYYIRVRPSRIEFGVDGRVGNYVKVVVLLDEVVIYLEPSITASPGEIATMEVSIKNPIAVTGFQFDLAHDPSIIIPYQPAGADRISDPDWFHWKRIRSDLVRYVVHNDESPDLLSPGDGPVMILPFFINSQATPGQVIVLDPINVHVSDSMGELIPNVEDLGGEIIIQ